LFVQRCILNLEPEVMVDADADADWLQWQWMSRYRVWEANRKVFLYPENWIQPELRREKSPFFKDMENELLQAEVTKDTAEEAFRVYLEKLDAVARLEVVGIYHEAADPNVFHVVARKPGNPPTYYYRQWIDSSRWTAWTKIDLDIVSDHVLPVVWNRRLYLFWAVVSRKPDRTQQNPSMQLSGSTPSSARVHLEVQLAWSEFKANKWLPTQTAPQTLVLAQDVDGFELTLRSSLSGPLLRIDLFIRETHFFSFDHRHFAEFVLGGVGNAVEAFVVTGSDLTNVGPETRGIGELGSALVKGSLSPPLFNVYDGMALTTWAFAPLSASRPSPPMSVSSPPFP